nr:amidase family protein [Oceanobacillus profundus]
MKPTFGLVSKKGSFPLAYTLDHLGPITTNINDNALLLNIIAGYDPEDPYSLNKNEQTDYTRLIGEDVKGMTIGVATNDFFTDVDKEIKASIDKALNIFKPLQLNRKEVSLPGIEEIAAEQAVTIKAEASAVHADHLERYHHEMDEEVYERLLASKQVKGYEYIQAQTKRAKLIENLNRIFDEMNALLVPTLPILPPNIGQRVDQWCDCYSPACIVKINITI